MRLEQRARQPEDLQQWLAGVVALLLIAVLATVLHGCGVQICLFRRLTGWPCLTCGSMRAAAALVSGDLAGAVCMQPLAVAAGLSLFLCLGVYTAALFLFRRVLTLRLAPIERSVCWLVTALLAMLNWLYLVRCGI